MKLPSIIRPLAHPAAASGLAASVVVLIKRIFRIELSPEEVAAAVVVLTPLTGLMFKKDEEE